MSRRVVITGVGAITPLGVGAKLSWERLIAGRSGLVSTSTFPDYYSLKWDQIPAKVVGKVPQGPLAEGKWEVSDHMEPSESRRLATFAQYGMAASAEALRDAGLISSSNPNELSQPTDLTRIGVAVGSGIGSFDDIYDNALAFDTKGYRKIHPLMVPRLLVNMAGGNISIKWGLTGPLHAVLTACATGLQAIGDAYNFIQNNYADVMVCGGTEAALHPLALSGFARARSVTTEYNDLPECASRPFDAGRSGFVLGEGCGIMVIEFLDHAISRGVKPNDVYAEISGYGFCGDSHHITAPREDGDGPFRSMEMALARSSVRSQDVQYVNAHATSTAIGDRAEINGLNRLMSQVKSDEPLTVSSTKSSTGHLLGAAGAVEAIFTAMTVKTGICPPTLNLKLPGGLVGDNAAAFSSFDFAANGAIIRKVDNAICNLFGFGGVNSSLCLSLFDKSGGISSQAICLEKP